MGKRVVAFVTDMDQPLGSAVGNAVEVRLAMECLRGRGPGDIMDLVRVLGAAMLLLGEKAGSWPAAEGAIARAIAEGSGLRRFAAMVAAQGGDPAVVDDPGRLPAAPVRVDLPAPSSGFVLDVDPYLLGEAVVDLGGGRRRAEDRIDPAVGVLLHKRHGDRVERGEPLASVLAADEAGGRRVAAERVGPAYRLGPAAPPRRALVKYLVTSEDRRPWRGGETWEG
jgi:thymidine phosphorylase